MIKLANSSIKSSYFDANYSFPRINAPENLMIYDSSSS